MEKNISDLAYILENAEDEETVKLFLSVHSVLDGTGLGMATRNENVSLEYFSLVLQKQKEELLRIACQQESDDLLSFLLEKESYLANFRMFDGRYILQFAAEYAYSESIIHALLWYGAIIEAEDREGKNVMHYAAKNKSDAIWLRLSNDSQFLKLLERADSTGKLPERVKE